MSEHVIQFGKKYKGRNIADIPYNDLQNYIEWLEQSDIKPGTFMDEQLKKLKGAFASLQPPAQPAAEPEKEEKKGPRGRKPNTNKNDPYKGERASGTTKRIYMTSAGTELPLLNLRGKEYLEVKYRLVWFREEHPDWSIETELVSVTDTSAYARAMIKDEHGRIIATSHKFESVKGFPDFIEKAETGSIGRALALLGYGTQFCTDIEEGDRQVDDGVGHEKPPSEPEFPRATDGRAIVAIEVPKGDKETQALLKKYGFKFNWELMKWARYSDGVDSDLKILGLDFETIEPD